MKKISREIIDDFEKQLLGNSTKISKHAVNDRLLTAINFRASENQEMKQDAFPCWLVDSVYRFLPEEFNVSSNHFSIIEKETVFEETVSLVKKVNEITQEVIENYFSYDNDTTAYTKHEIKIGKLQNPANLSAIDYAKSNFYWDYNLPKTYYKKIMNNELKDPLEEKIEEEASYFSRHYIKKTRVFDDVFNATVQDADITKFVYKHHNHLHVDDKLKKYLDDLIVIPITKTKHVSKTLFPLVNKNEIGFYRDDFTQFDFNVTNDSDTVMNNDTTELNLTRHEPKKKSYFLTSVSHDKPGSNEPLGVEVYKYVSKAAGISVNYQQPEFDMEIIDFQQNKPVYPDASFTIFAGEEQKSEKLSNLAKEVENASELVTLPLATTSLSVVEKPLATTLTQVDNSSLPFTDGEEDFKFIDDETSVYDSSNEDKSYNEKEIIDEQIVYSKYVGTQQSTKDTSHKTPELVLKTAEKNTRCQNLLNDLNNLIPEIDKLLSGNYLPLWIDVTTDEKGERIVRDKQSKNKLFLQYDNYREHLDLVQQRLLALNELDLEPKEYQLKKVELLEEVSNLRSAMINIQKNLGSPYDGRGVGIGEHEYDEQLVKQSVLHSQLVFQPTPTPLSLSTQQRQRLETLRTTAQKQRLLLEQQLFQNDQNDEVDGLEIREQENGFNENYNAYILVVDEIKNNLLTEKSQLEIQAQTAEIDKLDPCFSKREKFLDQKRNAFIQKELEFQTDLLAAETKLVNAQSQVNQLDAELKQLFYQTEIEVLDEFRNKNNLRQDEIETMKKELRNNFENKVSGFIRYKQKLGVEVDHLITEKIGDYTKFNAVSSLKTLERKNNWDRAIANLEIEYKLPDKMFHPAISDSAITTVNTSVNQPVAADELDLLAKQTQHQNLVDSERNAQLINDFKVEQEKLRTKWELDKKDYWQEQKLLAETGRKEQQFYDDYYQDKFKKYEEQGTLIAGFHEKVNDKMVNLVNNSLTDKEAVMNNTGLVLINKEFEYQPGAIAVSQEEIRGYLPTRYNFDFTITHKDQALVSTIHAASFPESIIYAEKRLGFFEKRKEQKRYELMLSQRMAMLDRLLTIDQLPTQQQTSEVVSNLTETEPLTLSLTEKMVDATASLFSIGELEHNDAVDQFSSNQVTKVDDLSDAEKITLLNTLQGAKIAELEQASSREGTVQNQMVLTGLGNETLHSPAVVTDSQVEHIKKDYQKLKKKLTEIEKVHKEQTAIYKSTLTVKGEIEEILKEETEIANSLIDQANAQILKIIEKTPVILEEETTKGSEKNGN